MEGVLCWKCGKPVEGVTSLVPFRATCDHCSSYLHVCKNCVHYKPGRANDCEIPDIENVVDKEHCNFCDEFSMLGEHKQIESDIKKASDKLFGDDDEDISKGNSFDDLFN